MKRTLAHDTQMWTRLADGAVEPVTVPAGTVVIVDQRGSSDTPHGVVAFMTTTDGKYTRNDYTKFMEDESCN